MVFGFVFDVCSIFLFSFLDFPRKSLRNSAPGRNSGVFLSYAWGVGPPRARISAENLPRTTERPWKNKENLRKTNKRTRFILGFLYSLMVVLGFFLVALEFTIFYVWNQGPRSTVFSFGFSFCFVGFVSS